MTVSEQIEQRHQEDLQRLRGFRLLDDDFLTKCFEGSTECIQLVLQIVLEIPDLEIVAFELKYLLKICLSALSDWISWQLTALARRLM